MYGFKKDGTPKLKPGPKKGFVPNRNKSVRSNSLTPTSFVKKITSFGDTSSSENENHDEYDQLKYQPAEKYRSLSGKSDSGLSNSIQRMRIKSSASNTPNRSKHNSSAQNSIASSVISRTSTNMSDEKVSQLIADGLMAPENHDFLFSSDSSDEDEADSIKKQGQGQPENTATSISKSSIPTETRNYDKENKYYGISTKILKKCNTKLVVDKSPFQFKTEKEIKADKKKERKRNGSGKNSAPDDKPIGWRYAMPDGYFENLMEELTVRRQEAVERIREGKEKGKVKNFGKK